MRPLSSLVSIAVAGLLAIGLISNVSAQTQEFRVGGRDADGMVITSIGKVCTGETCNPTKSDVPVELQKSAAKLTSAISDPDLKSMVVTESGFRKSFVEAVKRAQDKGSITGAQAFKLRVASFSPGFVKQAEKIATVEGCCTGEIPYSSVGAVDWNALADFLERILPLILEFLAQLGLL